MYKRIQVTIHATITKTECLNRKLHNSSQISYTRGQCFLAALRNPQNQSACLLPCQKTVLKFPVNFLSCPAEINAPLFLMRLGQSWEVENKILLLLTLQECLPFLSISQTAPAFQHTLFPNNHGVHDMVGQCTATNTFSKKNVPVIRR